MAQHGIKPEELKDQIILMSTCNNIDWSQGDENFKKCVSNSPEVQAYAHRFPKGHWSFFGPRTEKKSGVERTRVSPKNQWNPSAEMMMLTLRESGHPVFRQVRCIEDS